MPKYVVEFQETCTYRVEFDSDMTFEELHGIEDAWFETVDRQNPDWAKQNLMEVTDRQLISLNAVTPKDEGAEPDGV